MKNFNFVHLHAHSDHSFLNSLIRIPELVKMAAEYKMPALALTDHGNLFGAFEFFKTAIKSRVKPIIGAELFIAPGSISERKKEEQPFHLVLLCQNQQGYKNLCQLITASWLEGFNDEPRIDHNLLEKHGNGLVGLSGCLSGEIPQLLLSGNIKGAEERLEWYQSVLGRDNFYLELQENGLKEQKGLNLKLVELAKRTDAPLVCTNNCHYLKPDEAILKKVLGCIKHNEKINEQDLLKTKNGQLYFRTAEEMNQLFGKYPEALKNTLGIAEKCDFFFDCNQLHMPQVNADEIGTADDILSKKARSGLTERLPFLNQKGKLLSAKAREYKHRFEYELEFIKGYGVASHFLIAEDITTYARKQNILVSPGRGAAPSSLVNFALGITKVDPIEHGLFFERFSKTITEIDIDVSSERQQEIMHYLKNKYGEAQVANVITFQCSRLRRTVRDVGIILNLPLKKVDEIVKLIPLDSANLCCALEQEPRLKKMTSSDHKVDFLFKIAARIEGLHLTPGLNTHIVLADKPIADFVPLYKNEGKEEPVLTQFVEEDLRKLGLVTYGLLGIKTLAAMDRCLKLIREKHGNEINIDKITLKDKKTWELFAKGDTDGVFFMEADGIKQRLNRLKPENIEQLTAVNALYRPGPLQYGIFDSYINRKNGDEPVEHICPAYDKIVKDTLGLILYSEQVMMVAHELAGYPMDKAYVFFKHILLRNPEIRGEFIKGCARHKIAKAQAEQAFDEIESLGPHVFMKSHALCDALLTYQTAWLKANYPQEFSSAFTKFREN